MFSKSHQLGLNHANASKSISMLSPVQTELWSLPLFYPILEITYFLILLNCQLINISVLSGESIQEVSYYFYYAYILFLGGEKMKMQEAQKKTKVIFNI